MGEYKKIRELKKLTLQNLKRSVRCEWIKITNEGTFVEGYFTAKELRFIADEINKRRIKDSK